MKIQKTVNIKNKRATFDYEIIERMVAGICLVGTEIKSIRLGKANLSDSFCYFEKSEMYVRNLSISEYDYGTHYNHIAKRERKLLLQKKEIRKWERKIKETGLTIIPLRLFITDKGFAKMEIGLAKGKKNYDKRETLKLNDAKREMDRKKRF
ncbi:SsrA-binding protein SmpB [Halosquirtibacter xylanolyticus]|uniref:SsrA-binding protein SmpB n=1 Tax=Halosquirtibacter xylanolyticus TaxID=3374599 RepID=UPI003747ECCB|nr:SsrA-binding protein SmpB [Prolixibacteraceae bacterium]